MRNRGERCNSLRISLSTCVAYDLQARCYSFKKSGTTLLCINFSSMPLCLALASTLYLAPWLRRLGSFPLFEPRRSSTELRPDLAASVVRDELPLVVLLPLRSSLVDVRREDG